jgi:FKBP-type peptidyl-prolyl cis-trans isomerase
MRLRRFAAVLLPLAFTACLQGTDYTTNPTPAVPIEQTTFASSLNVDLSKSTKTASGLYFRDVTVGTGAEVPAGGLVSVYYQGYLANGTRFDYRLSPSATYDVRLGSPGLIQGWSEGIVGMKVGGTRQLIVPSTLAYGPYGTTDGVIPPNAVLVFTVELKNVQQ